MCIRDSTFPLGSWRVEQVKAPLGTYRSDARGLTMRGGPEVSLTKQTDRRRETSEAEAAHRRRLPSEWGKAETGPKPDPSPSPGGAGRGPADPQGPVPESGTLCIDKQLCSVYGTGVHHLQSNGQVSQGDVVFCCLCSNLHDMAGDANSQRCEVSSVYSTIQAVY